MSEIITAISDAGLGVATVLVLAYLVIQQNKTIRALGDLISKNTEAIHGLKDSIEKLANKQ